MTAVKNEVSLKVVVCAAAALVLTTMGSWSFVESTSQVATATNVTENMGEIVISAARQVAQNTPAVLVD